MAKSFLDKLLDFTGFTPPASEGHYHPSMYRDETPQPKSSPAPKKKTSATGSSVDKYIQKKQPKKAATDESLTGVAKFLAKKQQAAQQHAKQEAKRLANMTGVERYLAKRQKSQPTESQSNQANKKEAPPKNLTGVEKYLARNKADSTTKPKPQTAIPEKPVAQAKPATTQAKKVEKEQPSPAKKEETKVAPKKETTEVKKEEPAPKPKATSTKLINYAETADQCQAKTKKGTQCRRKTNLEILDKTINKHKYKFAVCSQHNNADFMPVDGLVK